MIPNPCHQPFLLYECQLHPCAGSLPQFLDTLIQREPVQKAAFLRDLPAMCAQFDTRVLRYKVCAAQALLVWGSFGILCIITVKLWLSSVPARSTLHPIAELRLPSHPCCCLPPLLAPSCPSGAAATAWGAAGCAAAAHAAAHHSDYCERAAPRGVCRRHAAGPQVRMAIMAVLDCAAKASVGYLWRTPCAIKFHPCHPTRRPLLTSASGETLLLLVQNAELLAKCMPLTVAAEVLPALLVRAAQHGEW